jgi:prepilin-type N-terminal cleavage/methylation domain-containing protein
MKHMKSGLTLIEILVSLAILSIIIVSTSSLFGSSLQVSQTAISSSQLQQTLRSAGQIIGDEIQRAIYIFPPQGSTFSTQSNTTVTVNWSSFVLGSGNRKTGPHEPANGEWQVPLTPSAATPPFLAMITAPIRPDVSCRDSDTGAVTENQALNISAGDGCYKFIAYFPVLRPKVTRGLVGNSTTSNELLDVNEGQSGTWVIMEFRMNLTEQTGSVPWNRVGCQFRTPRANACLIPPSVDPIRAAPDLPALTCTRSCDPVNASNLPKIDEVTAFRTRILSTISWINTQAISVQPEILIDDIDASYANGGPGFVIRTGGSVDPRGVFQVRLGLRAKQKNIIYGGNSGTPISFFFIPRNITPFKAAAP